MKTPAAACLLLALLLSACAPLTERQRDIRDYRRVEQETKFLEFRERCRARGGMLVVDVRGRIGRKVQPRPTDLYRCY